MAFALVTHPLMGSTWSRGRPEHSEMRIATAMNDLDWLGQDGGRLALAFAAGCVATFGFMSAVGSFLWKMIGGQRKDRITELEAALAAERTARETELSEERQHCAQQLQLLSNRIQQLETMFTMHTGIKMALATVPEPATLSALGHVHDVEPDKAD